MPGPFRNKPGRTYVSTFERFSTSNRQVAALAQNTNATQEDESERKPLVVKNIDLCVSKNVVNHHTEEYDITEDHYDEEGKEKPAQLVVRRGEMFDIKVTFDRQYDNEDILRVVFEIGDDPIVSKDTCQSMPVAKGIRLRHWSAGVKRTEDDVATIEILCPATSIVGRWNLVIETNVKGAPPKSATRHVHKNPVYILFNPWCREDSVYVDNDVELDEYVCNDHGKVYTGNYKQIAAKPWNFGQYEDFVLDCCMDLLELSKLGLPARCEVISVVRAISAVANSPDDSGVLVGNWSGNYSDGTAPTHWVGSVAILEQFHKTKQPVKFGQCWVFSGICVTICRALGIPCRSVTNYSSAHDCDGSITIDTHWNYKGEPMEDFNQDSVWNFHVWNEAWMTRPDLPAGYGGWQAFDATPQETSDGIYCAGPCSISAIKQGHVNIPYDAKFIFAEVNADKVHWILDANNEWTKKIQKHGVGRRISTKKPRHDKEPKRPFDPWRVLFKDDKDRSDLTEEYKYKEGTEEERTAVYRANTWSTRSGVYDYGTEDVKFEVCQKDDILVGSNFDVVVRAQNKSREVRRVTGTVTLTAMYYTGVPKAKVKTSEFELTLGPVRAEDAIMRITGEEYLHLIVDQVAFKISVLAMVEETKQVYADHDDFRLRRPDLEIECCDSIQVGKPVKCKIHFSNSMPIHLTQCEWTIEGTGMKRITLPQKDLEPYDKVTVEATLTPRKKGDRQIMASFTSKELTDVTGLHDVDVLAD